MSQALASIEYDKTRADQWVLLWGAKEGQDRLVELVGSLPIRCMPDRWQGYEAMIWQMTGYQFLHWWG